MDKIDVVIVGGGLAGLSCAWHLAEKQIPVMVLERGDSCGSKNVTGGRIYMNPVRRYLPEQWDEAPLERHVTSETLTMMDSKTSVSFQLNSQRFNEKPHHSFTVLRAKLDNWLAERVMAKGGFIIPQKRVEELMFKGGRVCGVRVDGEEIPADVVVAADGAMSFTAERAGLFHPPQDPKHFAVGMKEIIKLDPKTIDERFNLRNGEGAARLFAGAVTKGISGGGFLYTNRDSVSLGIVVGLEAFMNNCRAGTSASGIATSQIEIHALLDDFKLRPEIAALIEGGSTAEYSAHMIPEIPASARPRLFGDGILVAGDAAGLALNMMVTVRGMEFAVASGAIAARAIEAARQKNDFSAGGLQVYRRMLKDSFVLKDHAAFDGAQKLIANPRLFKQYPELICGLFEDAMQVGDGPKGRLSCGAMKRVNSAVPKLDMLRDLLDFLRL